MIPAGYCQHCATECQDVTGQDIWPGGGPALAAKVIWRCNHCGARVGSHPNGKPLGTAANAELRRARIFLHGRLDPIWKEAHLHPAYADGAANRTGKSAAIIARTARHRIYRYLAYRMGLTKDECHVSMFDLENCRRAWRALSGVTYDTVREWAKNNPAEAGPKSREETPNEGIRGRKPRKAKSPYFPHPVKGKTTVEA